MNYADLISSPVPQTVPLDDRQVKNNAGGYVYQIDDWGRLDRFLILGSDAQTFYQSARALTRENADCVLRCLAANPARAIAAVIEISISGRAPKNDPAIFVLALAAVHSDGRVRALAFDALPQVCRTATHLFQFVAVARTLGRGWGRGMKRAVAKWYEDKTVDALAYQAVKYRNREGYTHKRILQTAHPKAKDDDRERVALYRWICGKPGIEAAPLPAIVRGHELAMENAANAGKVASLINEYRLPWEAVPTEVTTDPRVWSAMLPFMGLTALIRGLAKMTAHGVLKPMSSELETVIGRLGDREALRKARVHPFSILLALATYRNGHGDKGSLRWDPVPAIIDALDRAFYASFENVEPTGKRVMIALDVSGSMVASMNGSALTVREAGMALALVTAVTESKHFIVGFSAAGPNAWVSRPRPSGPFDSDGIAPLGISTGMRLDAALRVVDRMPFGSTDCALPVLYAIERGLDVDAFVVITDSETGVGREHPSAALRRYRQKTGIPAKLAVIGMTSNGFSIADPADAGMLDFVGFDASGPALLADFIRQ